MGKSLFLTQEKVNTIQRSLDNLVIAKILYDEGTPLPPDTVFYAENAYDFDDTVFFKAIASIFGSVICTLGGVDDEKLSFSVRIPLVEEWMKLTKGFSNSEKILEEQDYFMAPIVEEYIEDGFYEKSMTCELVPYGLNVQIEGYYGSYHDFVNSVLDFKKRIQEKVEEYRKGREESGRNAHYSKRRNELRQCRQAV